MSCRAARGVFRSATAPVFSGIQGPGQEYSRGEEGGGGPEPPTFVHPKPCSLLQLNCTFSHDEIWVQAGWSTGGGVTPLLLWLSAGRIHQWSRPCGDGRCDHDGLLLHCAILLYRLPARVGGHTHTNTHTRARAYQRRTRRAIFEHAKEGRGREVHVRGAGTQDGEQR